MEEEKKYTFVLTENEANAIVQALADQPYSKVFLLLENLQKQFRAQYEKPKEEILNENKN